MEVDAPLRQAVAHIIGGLALLLFGLVLAVIALLPNAGLTALIALVISVWGLLLIGSGGQRTPRTTGTVALRARTFIGFRCDTCVPASRDGRLSPGPP